MTLSKWTTIQNSRPDLLLTMELKQTEKELVMTLVMTLICPTCLAAAAAAASVGAAAAACRSTPKFSPSYSEPKRVVSVEAVVALVAAAFPEVAVSTLPTAEAEHEASPAVSVEHPAVSTSVDKGPRMMMMMMTAHRPIPKMTCSRQGKDGEVRMVKSTTHPASIRSRGGTRRPRPLQQRATDGSSSFARSAWSSLPPSFSSPRRP